MEEGQLHIGGAIEKTLILLKNFKSNQKLFRFLSAPRTFFSRYNLQGGKWSAIEQKGMHSNHDLYVVDGKQCRAENA